MNAAPQPIVFVEDDDELRSATMQAFDLAEMPAFAFASAEEALRSLDGFFDGVVVSDIRMPGMGGIELLRQVQSIDPDIPLILVTGHGDVALAVQALKLGAFDFITKPFASDHLLSVVRNALERRALQIKNRRLRAAAEASDASSPLIGASAAMARLRSMVRALAAANVDVLIEGETGTGKEVVAQLLYRLGPQAGRPFIPVNCAASHEADFEASLFGSTAAAENSGSVRRGAIAAANSGTLLLDEVDGLPLPVQARLLRVLEERELLVPGCARPEVLTLRVLSTTKVCLQQAVVAGTFRPDLFHRLASTRIRIPPLREREDDVLLLFDLFLCEMEGQFGKAASIPDKSARARLRTHDWPGNVRELRSFVTTLVLRQDATTQESSYERTTSLKERLTIFERDEILGTLKKNGGNVGLTITDLGLARKTFYDRVDRLGIDLKLERKRFLSDADRSN